MQTKVLLSKILCGTFLVGVGFGLGVQSQPAAVIDSPPTPPSQTALLHLEPASTGLVMEAPKPNQELF